ncbi:MAG: hypothetical protein JST92_19155 [Deltaproteobacteria bacterium]|nr:hypothetical protein [Deltaproteobacteria bacterium]
MTARLGDILIAQGALDQEKLSAALSDQQAFGGKLGRTLVDLGYITEDQLVVGLAEQLGLATVDLATAEIEMDALSCVPVDACERYGVFPVKVNRDEGVLWIATAEPDRNALQEVAQIAQLTLEPMLAPMSTIDRAVRQYYYGEKGAPKARLGEPLAGIPLDPGQTEKPALAKAPAKNAKQQLAEAAAANQYPEIPDPGELQGIAPSAPAGMGNVDDIKTLLLRIEKQVSAQGRAFRALVDLLQEKGVVRRGELGSRTTKNK